MYNALGGSLGLYVTLFADASIAWQRTPAAAVASPSARCRVQIVFLICSPVILCPELLNTSTNSDVNTTDTEYGTVVEITCDPGYTIDGGGRRKVVQCGAGGAWAPGTTTCQR